MAVAIEKAGYQKEKECLEACLGRQERYDIYMKTFSRRNSYFKTDPGVKDDHMRNAQLKSRYNIQIGVDSEYIHGSGNFCRPE